MYENNRKIHRELKKNFQKTMETFKRNFSNFPKEFLKKFYLHEKFNQFGKTLRKLVINFFETFEKNMECF